jgi:hypothetical protein
MREINLESNDNQVSKPENVDMGLQAKPEKTNIPTTEVFDSSRYDAMNDLTKGASTSTLTDKNAAVELQKKKPLKPEEIGNNSIITSPMENNTTAPSGNSGLNPMLVEERARTMREMKKEDTSEVSSTNQNIRESPQEVNVMDHGLRSDPQDNSIIPVWTNAVMHHYAETIDVGMKLYSEFLTNASEVTYSWFKLWFQNSLWKG